MRRLQHPAYVRWRLCVELLAREGHIRLPDDTEVVHTLLSTYVDNLIFIQATHGTVDGYELGDLANYGDAAVCQRLLAVIQKPKQFPDVLLEVSCAAWHVSRGHNVTATEDKGMPDLALEIPDWRLPIQADCKHVGKDTGYSRFKNVIEKANSQIKRANQCCYGLVYLDVSDRVAKANFGDSFPDEIVKIQEVIQRCLRQHYTSVGGVVLLWKDYITLPMTDGSGGVLWFLRYRSHLIRHSGEAKAPLPEDPEPIMLGYTGMLKYLPNELSATTESRDN
jgi:hypothetical protein